MSRKSEQRKHGTTDGSPRRRRTARAERIRCQASKAHCACQWGGWGQISVDGLGHYNPDRSEDPWGRAGNPLAWWCVSGTCISDTVRREMRDVMRTKAEGKLDGYATSVSGKEGRR